MLFVENLLRKMLKSKTLLLAEWPTLHWESIVHT